jgi:dTDP-4-amino-4,6-dideoxygalactose transaminase
MQPPYKKKTGFFRWSKSTYPVAEEMYKNGLCLPSYVTITRSEVEYVCKVINENV